MKKMKKSIKMGVVCGVVSILMSTTVLAASRETLFGGKCVWTGGISDNLVYSQFEDRTNDRYYYNGTVYVRNDRGQQRSKIGKTTGVGSNGRVRVTITATYSNPFVANKAWYANIRQCK